MRVEVRPLYSNGKPVPAKIREKDAVRSGDLTIIESRNDALGRVVILARLISHVDMTESLLLPELTDVHIVWLAAAKMRLRGNEMIGDVWYAQTWEVRVL